MSQLQSDTARINGAKSRGPKSAEGRAISSQNALRHGFTACNTTLLKCENPDEFEDSIAHHFETYHPSDAAQEALVNEMISARWRIRRLRVIETQLIDLEMMRNHAEIEKKYDQPDSTIQLTEAMRALMEERGRKLVWFRYPFLDSGTTPEAHQAIVDFLEQRHYRVAHVTVDYKDYSFAGVYTRLMRAGDAETAGKVKQAYLDQIDPGFEHAEKASVEVFGREIPQILLIHCNELNSVTLRESIARMRKRGYSFVSLDEATKDEAYQRPTRFRVRAEVGCNGPRSPWARKSRWIRRRWSTRPSR